MTKRVLRKALGSFDRVKKTKEIEIPALLGFTINGVNTVAVSNRAGFVWARIRNNQNEPVQAYNDAVSNVYNLPVVLIREESDRTRYKVKGKDQGVYQSWGGNSYLPIHGNQHSFDPDSGGGGDVTFVHNRQFTPLLATPSGSAGAMDVIIHPFSYYQNNLWHYAGGTGTTSFAPYKPTGSNARMVLVYLDGNGNPQLQGGTTYFSVSITGNAAVLPYVPSMTDPNGIPITGVRLVSGTSIINWDNLYDLRPIIVGDGFIPTGTSGHTIQDDGTPLAQQNNLNFVGNAFSVYNSGGATNVSGTFISSGIPERSIPVYEDNIFRVTGTILNFIDNLDVIVSGSVAYIKAQTGAGLNVIGIFDDSVFKVSGSAISFDSNLSVVSTGSVAFVSSSGGGYPPSWKYDINQPKTVVDTPDDDFTSTILNAKWTVTQGIAGTVSLISDRYNAIYDLNSVTGYLAVQVGFSGTAKTFCMRQDYTIPTGSSIILAVNPTFLMQGAGTLSNDELQVGLAINNNDNSYSSGTWLGLFLDAQSAAPNIRVWFSDFSSDFGIMSGLNLIGHQIYLRIHKLGTTTYQGFVSLDGISWIPMGDTGLLFAEPNNIWIFADSKAAMATSPPIPIQLFDWIRLGTGSSVHPW